MNNPGRVINFVNAAHFIDHYSMLIFAAAVIVMGPALGMAYSELLPYATPGFVAFGAGSLITGWLGDRWSRRHMMVIFFVGIGLSMISVGLVQTPIQLGVALLAIGIFASIYHPVGTAMIVSYADKLGREITMIGCQETGLPGAMPSSFRAHSRFCSVSPSRQRSYMRTAKAPGRRRRRRALPGRISGASSWRS